MARATDTSRAVRKLGVAVASDELGPRSLINHDPGAVLLLAGASWGGGRAAALAAGEEGTVFVSASTLSSTIQRTNAKRANDPHLGQKAPIELSIEPYAIVSSDGEEALEVAIDVGSYLEDDARYAYAFTLTHERGGSRVTRSEATHEVGKGQWSRTLARLTKGNLPDGYFEARLTLVARTRSGKEVVADSLTFFESVAGALSPVSEEDWHNRSDSTLGRNLQPGVGVGSEQVNDDENEELPGSEE